MNRYLHLVLPLLLLFAACQTDEALPTPPADAPPATGDPIGEYLPPASQLTTSTGIRVRLPLSEPVNATLHLRVRDESGSGLENARVYWGNSEAITDESGYAQITGTVDREHARLRVELDGYFKAFPVLSIPGTISIQHQVTLVRRVQKAAWSTTESGVIPFANGGQIRIPANGVQRMDSTDFIGTVHAYATYIDPTAPHVREIMPGNLTGTDTESQRRLLQSLGMVNVELADDDGTLLQLRQPAIIDLPIPPTLLAHAPVQVPLWYFDEPTGQWVADGMATRANDRYVGSVNHFTPWNVDVPIPLVRLSGRLAPTFRPSSDQLRYVDLETGAFGSIITDAGGRFFGMVPLGRPISIEVMDGCYTTRAALEGATYYTNTDIGEISFGPDYQPVIISGYFVDCNLSPVISGYVEIRYPNTNTTTIGLLGYEGNFEFDKPICIYDSIEIRGYDQIANKRSAWQKFAYAPRIKTGVILTCESADNEYIDFSIHDESYHIPNARLRQLYDSNGSFRGYGLSFHTIGEQSVVRYALSYTKDYASNGGAKTRIFATSTSNGTVLATDDRFWFPARNGAPFFDFEEYPNGTTIDLALPNIITQLISDDSVPIDTSTLHVRATVE